eukprot:Rmarinus@m.2900
MRGWVGAQRGRRPVCGACVRGRLQRPWVLHHPGCVLLRRQLVWQRVRGAALPRRLRPRGVRDRQVRVRQWLALGPGWAVHRRVLLYLWGPRTLQRTVCLRM